MRRGDLAAFIVILEMMIMMRGVSGRRNRHAYCGCVGNSPLLLLLLLLLGVAKKDSRWTRRVIDGCDNAERIQIKHTAARHASVAVSGGATKSILLLLVQLVMVVIYSTVHVDGLAASDGGGSRVRGKVETALHVMSIRRNMSHLLLLLLLLMRVRAAPRQL